MFVRLLALTALLAAVCFVSLAEMAPAPPAGWQDHYVIANGIRIHYWRTGGAKPVLVLAHGSSDDGLCWTNLAKEFTDRYDVIMYDARGHGLSDPPNPADPPDAQAEDLAALIRTLQLNQPILMGHSMGSASVAWFAAKYPDVPRAVILEDPNLGAYPPAMAATPQGAERDKRVAAILERNNLTEDQLVEQCMKNSPLWGRNECEIWAPSKRRHHPHTALRGVGERPAMKDLFTKITCPTLIIKADANAELRQKNEEVARILKNGQIVHIDGAGHNVRREQKQRTIAVLSAFLAALP